MRYRSVGKLVGVSEFLRTFCGLGRRNAANFTGKLAQRLNRSGATLIDVRAADAVEAIAVEVFRQCECGGQPVTMEVINRALNQLRAHRPACKCGLCGETVAKAKADRAIASPRDTVCCSELTRDRGRESPEGVQDVS